MNTRQWCLMLIDVAVLVQIIFAAVNFVLYTNDVWLEPKLIPSIVHLILNGLTIIASFVVYVGIFELSNHLIATWMLLTVFLLQAFVVVLVLMCCFANMQIYHDKMVKKGSPIGRSTLIPGLSLCIWSTVLIRVWFFYSRLQEFKNHPTFLRHAADLMRQLSLMNQQRLRSAI